MQRNSVPIVWRPRGLSDNIDATDAFKGSMFQLQNLIPDPTTKGLWQCRPAATEIVNLSGTFTAPVGMISALKVIGNSVFGMVATGRFSGHDEPFCYNLLSNTFITISGVTSANTPLSPAATGPWTPPVMALIGAKLIVTHPGFTGAGGAFFGVLDISNPAAPAWSATNLTGAVTFSIPPTGVAQFNGRAYYIHNVIAQPAVILSDSLTPTNVTTANQVLTFGDNVPLTGLGPLALFNQLGGIIQSLMVFKDTQNIYQITGDPTVPNLTINALNVTTGTQAVNTIVTTPKGLGFVAPDGLRIIDFDAKVSDPVGFDGMGTTIPFTFSVTPSRMCAACTGTVMRITTSNGAAVNSPNQEFWYDFARGIWSGPHTFPASLIQPYKNTFIMAPIAVPGTLWQSDAVQHATSTFTENGALMFWNATTSMLPDTETMTQNCMTEAVWDMALAPGVQNVTVAAVNQNGSVMNGITLLPPVGGPTIWGSFTWGAAPWGGTPSFLTPQQLPWTIPITFTRMQIQATGQCAGPVRIGALHMRYQILRYLTNDAAAA